MKPLYLVGTRRNVGKTTLALGLLHALRQRGLKVGYMKPLGQRVTSDHGHVIHDDARLVASFLGQSRDDQVEMAVPLPSGRVEEEVQDLQTEKLLSKVREGYSALAEPNDLVIVEAMGHVAMGSCLGLSAGDVARELGAKTLLVSGGGVGRAIDNISLCETFLTARGAEFMGVVINQVWPSKYGKVYRATVQGLRNIGIKTYGVVPFEEQLSAPKMEQVYAHIGGEIVAGAEHMDRRVQNTIVAAMEASHMVRYLQRSTLVITPGDRTDNILASLSTQMLGDLADQTIAGLILTGGFRPDGTVMRLVAESHLPVIMVPEDTYSVASKIREAVFKISPDDGERIQWAVCLVSEYVDVDGIVEALQT